MSEVLQTQPDEPVVELVLPMNREELLEVDHRPGTDSDSYVYLQPESGDVFVNAEPKAAELGLPFWLKVLKREKVKEVEEHPFYYSPGKVAVAAAYGLPAEAA